MLRNRLANNDIIHLNYPNVRKSVDQLFFEQPISEGPVVSDVKRNRRKRGFRSSFKNKCKQMNCRKFKAKARIFAEERTVSKISSCHLDFNVVIVDH